MWSKNMAKPIKETPVLQGKQADNFIKAVEENKRDKSNKISKESYEKSKKLYLKVLSNATF